MPISSNQLLNKTEILSHFLNEWSEEKESYKEKAFIVNEMEIKIRGVKEPIRVKLQFKEPILNGLVLHKWNIEYASVKIGDGRKEAIKNEIESTLFESNLLLPNWISPHHFVCATHLQQNYSYTSSSTLTVEKEVEPEVLLDAFAEKPNMSDRLEKTRLVFHNGKIYERLLETGATVHNFDEMNAFVEGYKTQNKDFIIDKEGFVYEYYATPDDPDNIRVLTALDYVKPISPYIHSDKVFTFREVAAQKSIEFAEDLPLTQRTVKETEKFDYKNGLRVSSPFTSVVEIIIHSPRIMGEEIPMYRLGDYVEYDDKTGFVIDVAKKEEGIYQVQLEHSWVYYAGTEADTDTVHVSNMKKIDKPKQNDVGEMVFSFDSNGNGIRYGYMGEVVYEFTKDYILKIPAFEKERRLRSRKGYQNYHSKYVNNGDGFIYATVKKDLCVFMKKPYVYWYEKFRGQLNQFSWVKDHPVLGTYLYPLLKVLDSSVTHPSALDASHQLEAFILFVKFHTLQKKAEDIHADVVKMLDDKKYEALRSTTLRNIYDLQEDVLATYFSDEKDTEKNELLELLG